ncbi:hypothetical protein [Actinopolymorpha alba]|uniref:hypothetical protein n=1 Tax=Actinopolymorpha alba TaxID=533267 RepID=UPI00039D4CF2|nr:hypothetical protein [Actinopolymorpha alba]
MIQIRQVVAALALAVAVAATAGCGAWPATETSTSANPPAPVATERPTRTDAPPAAASAPSSAPDPRLPTPPATTSGPLTAANLPPASRIGPGFQPYSEPDAAEESFVSNGAPVRARKPGDVALSIVPLGCPGLDRLDPLPVPRHALEQTYRTPDGRAAVALALEYAHEDAAAALVSGLAKMLELCTSPASRTGLTTPRLVADLRQPDVDTLFDVRREVGPGADGARWDETVVRTGRRVGLVIVERRASAMPLDQTTMATALRMRLGT